MNSVLILVYTSKISMYFLELLESIIFHKTNFGDSLKFWIWNKLKVTLAIKMRPPKNNLVEDKVMFHRIRIIHSLRDSLKKFKNLIIKGKNLT